MMSYNLTKSCKEAVYDVSSWYLAIFCILRSQFVNPLLNVMRKVSADDKMGTRTLREQRLGHRAVIAKDTVKVEPEHCEGYLQTC